MIDMNKISRRETLGMAGEIAGGLFAATVYGASCYLRSHTNSLRQEEAEVLLVLMGEDPKTRTRSRLALQIHKRKGIPIILAGSHCGAVFGINLPEGRKPAFLDAKKFLLEQGVKIEKIRCPKLTSVDTLEDIYCVLEEGLVKERVMGIVTDGYHLPRSLWSARMISGNSKRFVGYPTNDNGGWKDFVREAMLLTALKIDTRSIAPGNLEGYMKTIHPYHALREGRTPELSLYGMIAKICAFRNQAG